MLEPEFAQHGLLLAAKKGLFSTRRFLCTKNSMLSGPTRSFATSPHTGLLIVSRDDISKNITTHLELDLREDLTSSGQIGSISAAFLLVLCVLGGMVPFDEQITRVMTLRDSDRDCRED